jgi:cation transport ATPase
MGKNSNMKNNNFKELKTQTIIEAGVFVGMNHKNSLRFTIFKIIMTLFILQGIRIAIKQIVYIFVDESITISNLIALSEMTLFIVLFRIISTKRGINLSVFPDLKKRKNNIAYFTATAVLLVLILLTPHLTEVLHRESSFL